MKKENSCGESIAALLLLPIVLVVSSILNGFVLMMLWQWFVLAIFKNAPHLTIASAIGLSMVVSFLTYNYRPENEQDNKQSSPMSAIFTVLLTVLLRAAFTLGIAAIVHQFV